MSPKILSSEGFDIMAGRGHLLQSSTILPMVRAFLKDEDKLGFPL